MQGVLQGKSRSIVIRELQRTVRDRGFYIYIFILCVKNLDVNMAVNNLLSRDDEEMDEDDAGDPIMPGGMMIYIIIIIIIDFFGLDDVLMSFLDVNNSVGIAMEDSHEELMLHEWSDPIRSSIQQQQQQQQQHSHHSHHPPHPHHHHHHHHRHRHAAMTTTTTTASHDRSVSHHTPPPPPSLSHHRPSAATSMRTWASVVTGERERDAAAAAAAAAVDGDADSLKSTGAKSTKSNTIKDPIQFGEELEWWSPSQVIK